jgi:hypothetical protein
VVLGAAGVGLRVGGDLDRLVTRPFGSIGKSIGLGGRLVRRLRLHPIPAA